MKSISHPIPSAVSVPLAFSMLLIAGCNAGPTLPPGKTGTVTGKATFGGEPLPVGATVTLTHEETSQVAVGTVKEEGAFTMKMKGGDLVLAGSYTVAVNPPSDTSSETPEEALAEMYMAEGQDSGEAAEDDWPQIPKNWRAADTSGKTFDVKEGENQLDLELKE